MPNRTTRDYEGPSVAPKIQAVLDAALEDEGDIDIGDRFALFAHTSVDVSCILCEELFTSVHSFATSTLNLLHMLCFS